MHKYFKRLSNTDYVLEWKFKGLSDESVKSPSAANNFLDHSLDYFGDKIRVKFNGSCLKEGKITYNHGKIVNIYIVYEISKNCNVNGYPTLENSLFGAVSLTKHVHIDRYKYSGVGFDRKGFLHIVAVEPLEM